MSRQRGPRYLGEQLDRASLNTDGGPRHSPKGEILDLGDGFYSVGEFGSIWCNMYNGGGNLGECLAFGRISACNCLGIA